MTLTAEEAHSLAEAGTQALADNRRFEFGSSALPMLARTFATSPYVNQREWCETLARLCDIFYRFKSETYERLGDVELTVHCAAELLKRAPEYDYLIAPEAKAIPLLYEMARQSGAEKYFLARKGPKAYMSGVFEVHVKSITTMDVQRLVIDTTDAALIKGKRILIIDDVISTGESLHAMEELVTRAGGSIVGRMAVLAEGAAQKRDDIIVLGDLPLFNPDGTVKA